MIISLIVAFAYLQIGFQLGRVGWRVWERKDNLSLGSFLLFPVSHANCKVGNGTMSLFQGVHPAQGTYRAAMTLFWPIAALFNGVAVALLGPGWLASLPTRRRDAAARRLEILMAQNRAWDAEIARLESDDDKSATRSRIATETVTDDDAEGDVRVNEHLTEEMRAMTRQWSNG